MESLSLERQEVLTLAEASIGSSSVRYKYGHPELGTSAFPGFDCSGFVTFVLLSCGISVPDHLDARGNRRSTRHTDELWETFGIPVHEARALPGDLVFFSKRGWRASHIGIFTGNGEFIHSPGIDGAKVHKSAVAEYVASLDAVPFDASRRTLYTANPIGYKSLPFVRTKEYRIRHYALR